jgi:hypothetical protein
MPDTDTTTADIPDVRLGKKLGVVEDRRTIRLADLITPRRPTPPRRNSVALNASFPMFANDEIGDCTCAALGQRIIAQERSSAQSSRPTVTVDDVIAAYSAVTGYDPARPETDQGAYLLDVLNYVRNTGIGHEKDGTTHTIGAFAKVDPADHNEVALAHWMFGGLYVGVGLPVAAQRQIGGLWDPTGNARQDRWGSWGGHAMYVQTYDTRTTMAGAVPGPTFVTWGDRQRATWRWWDTYVDECFAVISEDFLRTGTGKTPQGFDVAALTEQLNAL